ncbi:MAG: hypothetical protein PF436_03125 [Prolixibacteraceae bacterium]|jgi:hypothetical protein|nr:hypothetical protein [Prolixibacteraceae bacterium]
MKVKYLIILCLLAFFFDAYAVSLQQIYDNAFAGNGYDKLIILDSTIVYTGGFKQNVHSVCIQGNGAIINLNGQVISINEEGMRFDIDHCILISSSYVEEFISYENGAFGNVLNNTFYSINGNGNSSCGIKYSECVNDTSTIKNNIFFGFYAAVYYYTGDYESYYEGTHLETV